MIYLWDISPPIHTSSPVFPGDTPYAQKWVSRIGPRCPVNVSQITLSPHVGSHADAPLHYDDAGMPAGEMPLDDFIGPCRVIHAIGCGPLVEWKHVDEAVTRPNLPPRILVRTYNKAPLDRFDLAGSAYAPELLDRLAVLGVRLIGIDSASVDPIDSKSLDSHHHLGRLNLRVLENLVLDAVPEGDYELIALPLKLVQACASPVRAVLRIL
ncbi:arylformamidase [Methylobacter sp.]|jgi:arylformamidase|uniref:arylformamidase n=1 Tax=Methylobacter sp. TaxID=2051955 RepID=UPI003DA4F047